MWLNTVIFIFNGRKLKRKCSTCNITCDIPCACPQVSWIRHTNWERNISNDLLFS